MHAACKSSLCVNCHYMLLERRRQHVVLSCPQDATRRLSHLPVMLFCERQGLQGQACLFVAADNSRQGQVGALPYLHTNSIAGSGVADERHGAICLAEGRFSSHHVARVAQHDDADELAVPIAMPAKERSMFSEMTSVRFLPTSRLQGK